MALGTCARCVPVTTPSYYNTWNSTRFGDPRPFVQLIRSLCDYSIFSPGRAAQLYGSSNSLYLVSSLRTFSHRFFFILNQQIMLAGPVGCLPNGHFRLSITKEPPRLRGKKRSVGEAYGHQGSVRTVRAPARQVSRPQE